MRSEMYGLTRLRAHIAEDIFLLSSPMWLDHERCSSIITPSDLASLTLVINLESISMFIWSSENELVVSVVVWARPAPFLWTLNKSGWGVQLRTLWEKIYSSQEIQSWGVGSVLRTEMGREGRKFRILVSVTKNSIAWLALLSRRFARVCLFLGSCVSVSKSVYFVIFL